MADRLIIAIPLALLWIFFPAIYWWGPVWIITIFIRKAVVERRSA